MAHPLNFEGFLEPFKFITRFFIVPYSAHAAPVAQHRLFIP